MSCNNLAMDGTVLVKSLINFFANFAVTLGIKYEKLRSNYDDSNYNLDELIIRYNGHPNIFAI